MSSEAKTASFLLRLSFVPFHSLSLRVLSCFWFEVCRMSFGLQKRHLFLCVFKLFVVAFLLAGISLFAGCSQEPSLPGDRLRLCLSDSDCETGWKCVLNACQIRLSSNSRDGGIVVLPDLFPQDKPPVDQPPVDQPPTDKPPVDQPPNRCNSTADCKEPLLCDKATGKCVECLRTPDCNGQLCKHNQ